MQIPYDRLICHCIIARRHVLTDCCSTSMHQTLQPTWLLSRFSDRPRFYNKKAAVLSQSQGTTALLRDAEHLYRKLASNPWATQWIERTLKLSASIGKLSKNHFSSVPVKDWCMSPHGVTGPSDKSSWNSRNRFRFARPPTLPNLVALRPKVCEISVVEKFCSP